MSSNPQAENVNFDWMEPTRQVRIVINQDEARLLGLSSQSIATALNTCSAARPSPRFATTSISSTSSCARPTSSALSLDSLRSLQISVPGGRTVPLSQFATFEYGQEYPLVWRRDRTPTLTVQADVTPGVLPETVVGALQPQIEALQSALPAGYSIDVGGTVEESAKSQARLSRWCRSCCSSC